MLPDPLLHLIELLARLPGVGEKTAQRFALHLVAERSGTAQALGDALTHLGLLMVMSADGAERAQLVDHGVQLFERAL